MGKGSQGAIPSADGDAPLDRKLQQFTWEQVKEKTSEQKWLVIDSEVYNITNWARKHPGGSKVITHYAGQDATVSLSQTTFYKRVRVPCKNSALRIGGLDGAQETVNNGKNSAWMQQQIVNILHFVTAYCVASSSGSLTEYFPHINQSSAPIS